ncbi:putative oxidoreductase protein [Vibrio mediterranei AK1]|uniref:NAD(P)H-dependent flavin oxidoreductase n=1 Tax=Vibrio mediterranei TaxID=689 RepID=UPI0001542604|nr:nitronate monooxygenase [Vibrio mediterranei]EDL51923.1 putative oxidoreductase protein [Vibrio mediterranei AK1]
MKQRTFSSWLHTELPIIQAPMAGVQDSKLAIAVSEAGGLGSIPCGMLSKERIVEELESITSATDKPYNLNFFCHLMPNFDQERQAQWRNRLAPYFEELKLDIAIQPSMATRMPFSEDIADAIEAFKPPYISFHFGLPNKALLERVKSWGTCILSSATTVEEAVWLETNGADAIIAQGVEAGGHRGMFLTDDLDTQLPVEDLIKKIVDNVTVPVVAAGGISTADKVEHAFNIGAEVVQVGTAFLLCDEATTSALHRDAIKSTQSQHTAITNVYSGRPARGIVNRAMMELGFVTQEAPQFPYASIDITQLRGQAEQQGSADFSPLWCGESTDGCKEVSAEKILRDLARV